ncbi:insulin-like peptide receptor [Anabrus simplex]|uniref:insulin-like peptide receptor n=1 Tax=Anabrus simplex TaxID=316456 RepID=UPI0035A2D938
MFKERSKQFGSSAEVHGVGVMTRGIPESICSADVDNPGQVIQRSKSDLPVELNNSGRSDEASRMSKAVPRGGAEDASRPGWTVFSMMRHVFSEARSFSLSNIVTILALGGPFAIMNRLEGLELKSFVCQSVDVRNSVEAFDRRLRGCEVVEGFVQILLIDHADESSFANLSFPELREITGYLLLYRVNGLRSLSKLFPNLSVIRGNTLFLNYALVAFEMMHLQEIGLHSLTDILRGSVRLEKNPQLCYVKTIDWDLIAKAGKDGHYIKGNRNENECPMCPNGDKCPKSATGSPLCWNRNHCQKVCPSHCKNGTCDANGKCCKEYCLGGCKLNDTDCDVCRNFVIAGKCVQHCPSDNYEYLDRRCVREQECRDMKLPLELIYEDGPKVWKPFNGTKPSRPSCILECPSGYAEVGEGKMRRCEHCKGQCRKECLGASVDSIASAQRLRGCTYIKGSLEIQIRGGRNIVKELEDNLNKIEEIEGWLKIVRSFPLISLNFLKSLRIIHGKRLESNKFAFVVLDNQNLQELWDWSTREVDLQIRRGRLFFHFNPKLCYYKIESLKKVANLSEFTDLEVARNSNGDKVACNVTELQVTISKITSMAVIIAWKQFEHYDPRSLLGYVVYITEAPYRNVTLYDGRDACGGDGWRVDDVPVPDGANEVFHPLTRLNPYTQYAFYVKTYTIATERTGAQSPIQYFMTKPDTPSNPQQLSAYPTSDSSLLIEWRPPLRPNGNVTHYVVVGMWSKEDEEFLEQRDYCNEPLETLLKKPTQTTIVEKQETSKSCCACGEQEQDKITHKETEVQLQIHFEDSLHNHLYIKRPSHRSKREISGLQSNTVAGRTMMKERDEKMNYNQIFPSEDKGVAPQAPSGSDSQGETKGVYQKFRLVVRNGTRIEVKHLHHFAQYTIEVEACRELLPDELNNSTTNCSAKSFVTARTLASSNADTVNSSRLIIETMNQSVGSVKLKWDEPPEPNGLIVNYQIEYRCVDRENYKATEECITRSKYLEYQRSYTLVKLNPGNYSLRLRATSLAGVGNYTQLRYFYIPEPASSPGMELMVGAFVGSFFVVIVIGMVVLYLRRKYVPGVPNMKLIASVNPEYVPTVYVPDEWEVPRKKVELLRELGQGSFGMVYEGIGRDIVEGHREIRCAIKTVNEHATDRERSEFLNEASVMKAFNTHHVVRLLGVVSQGQPVLVVMELMANGDLKTYLRSHRPDVTDDPLKQPPTLKRILQMAIEIADGMAYLAAKKFVHRDLAARNCMVAEDLTVKIGDFGMTRDIYETDYYRKGTKGLLPVRWMAPESLKDGVFTSHSDVWSYGVVLWEMATLASQPYQGLSNDQVLRYVIDGGVMERPENCPDRLYDLMRLCWQYKPSARPSFLDLVTLLLSDVPVSFSDVSFYHSEEGCELRSHLHMELPGAGDDPATPLRVTRDIEDFSLGGSDLDDVDLDEEDEEEALEVSHPVRSSAGPFPHYQTMSSLRDRSQQPKLASGEDLRSVIVPSVDSQTSKVGNGSTATTPTAANGWVVGRPSNGASINSSIPAGPGIKTTEC